MTRFLLLSALALTLAACDTGGGVGTDDVEARPALENVADNVITATYGDLAAEAADLVVAVNDLDADRSDARLALAQQAWRDARAPWELSEGFLFGPVDTEGLDPSLDSWPVNQTDLDAVLASGASLTPSYVAGLEATLRGFHTIEYLLFGEDGDKRAADFTDREVQYLASATAVLRDDAARLVTLWMPSGGNYAAEIKNAGLSGSLYVSQNAAVQELIGGLITITDEVGAGKLGGPYGDRSTAEEESRFSGNSIADFSNNIRSVQNVYLGAYDGRSGAGLTDLVSARDEALDARVQAEITAAINAIEAIPAPFSTAIFESRPTVQAAIDAVLALRATLEGPVTAALR
ncbi:imelysin family protein [Rubricoccus marinus]|uniref:Imelysin-like domain-containing protein n=1 Tax=Rubricoccus marinus TaxID=716817 RepID=A0A259U0L9_9BACT|nr:imelysin family protein [Rubricoccus marinus]OZC03542.1 hypothetical protein BSZ36_11455 [Rubricoccus marinus]